MTHHPVNGMVAQSGAGLAPDRKNLCDHEELRDDPMLAMLSGKRGAGKKELAGRNTLHRLDLSVAEPSRYAKTRCRQVAGDELLVESFVEAHRKPRVRIVLDPEVSDVPLFSHQEGRFLHSCCDWYCDVPLHMFAVERLLCAWLRTVDQASVAGSKQEGEQIAVRLRERWPEVEIVVRGDPGFCRAEWMVWWQANKTGSVMGFARSERLRRLIAAQMEEATGLQQEAGRPAGSSASLSARRRRERATPEIAVGNDRETASILVSERGVSTGG